MRIIRDSWAGILNLDFPVPRDEVADGRTVLSPDRPGDFDEPEVRGGAEPDLSDPSGPLHGHPRVPREARVRLERRDALHAGREGRKVLRADGHAGPRLQRGRGAPAALAISSVIFSATARGFAAS